MLHYYLAVAFRHLRRNKLYAAISVGGLGLGFAAALLIALYVHDELGYDRWLPNRERIYQVWQDRSPDGLLPSDVGQWLGLDFPQTQAVARLFPYPSFLQRGDRKFNETVYWADPSVFEVFRLPVVAGDLDSALARRDGLVLTRRLAVKYFGRSSPIGETLLLDGEHPMRVTAVIEDLPSNTHLDLDVLASSQAAFSPAAEQDRTPLERFGAKLWNSYTYVLMRPDASVESVRAGLAGMQDRHTPISDPRGKVSEIYPLGIRPLADIHLSSGKIGSPGRDLSRLYAVSAIGALIMLAAAINFINLMTAVGAQRRLEVGVRKAVGAKTRHLLLQFLSETVLYVGASAVVGIVLGTVLLQPMNTFLARRISIASLLEPEPLVAAAVFLITVAIAAGLYPAAVLASFRADVVMKARAIGGGMHVVRQGLVVVQFAILIGLLIATTVIDQQMRFGMTEALAKGDDPIVVIQSACSEAFKSRVLAVSSVKGAACTSPRLPQWGSGWVSAIKAPDAPGFGIHYGAVDFGFFELFGYEAVAGRFFSNDLGTDAVPPNNVWTRPEALVVNETAVERLGFASPAEAVGRVVQFNHVFAFPATFTGVHDARIIGVVEDFQMGSVRDAIQPGAFYVHPGQFALLSVKLDARRLPEALAALDDAWNEFGGPGPMDRSFYEESVARMYLDIRRQTQLLSVFSAVAVLISILGLVGLAADAAAKRTKEIGIRKVLGARRSAVVRLLLWEFSKPVLFANALAWPVAFYCMSLWLGAFGRRIDLEPWMFAASAGAALAVAVATVLLRSWAIASTRPVAVLRFE